MILEVIENLCVVRAFTVQVEPVVLRKGLPLEVELIVASRQFPPPRSLGQNTAYETTVVALHNLVVVAVCFELHSLILTLTILTFCTL